MRSTVCAFHRTCLFVPSGPGFDSPCMQMYYTHYTHSRAATHALPYVLPILPVLPYATMTCYYAYHIISSTIKMIINQGPASP